MVTDQDNRNTSWDGVADWYDAWMGEAGGRTHRQSLIPELLAMLDLQPGESVLDIGCGQGALAQQAAAKGARYTGVDISGRMIEQARRRHGSAGRFVVADACHLDASTELDAASFDAAAFLVSLQDMEPLAAALRSAAWALKRGGRLAILTPHPAFQVPRQSGWGWDEGRKLRYRRIDRYLTPFAAPMPPRPGRNRRRTLLRFHRPVGVYVTSLVGCGFVIAGLTEVPAHRAHAPPRRPGAGHPRRGAFERARQEIPLFLGILAVRK
jgi:SAM-dependent methyltransferase